MTFSGTFTITKQDNIRYNFFRIKRKLAGLSIMTFLLLTLLLALVRFAQEHSFANLLSGALLTGAVGAALMAAAGLVSVVLRVNSLYKKGEMADFSVHYVVDQAGIHAKSSRGDADLGWKQVTLAQETTRAFYLLAGESRAVVIPKGQIEKEDERNTLRAMFRKYVTPGRVRTAR